MSFKLLLRLPFLVLNNISNGFHDTLLPLPRVRPLPRTENQADDYTMIEFDDSIAVANVPNLDGEVIWTTYTGRKYGRFVFHLLFGLLLVKWCQFSCSLCGGHDAYLSCGVSYSYANRAALALFSYVGTCFAFRCRIVKAQSVAMYKTISEIA